MRKPLLLHPEDNVVVLTEKASVPSGHKIARCSIGKDAPVIKFGQRIGLAISDIEKGAHVHTHNCAFSDHDQNYKIGADLAKAQAAIANVTPKTFMGYERSDGQIGTRNYIALIATVNCSASVIRKAAAEIEASGILITYKNVDGIVALAHGSGCGMASHGRGFDILDRVLWGHATHANVGAAIFVGLGCEVMQIARMQAQFGKSGMDRFHALTVQETGGTRATIEAIKSHVADILPTANNLVRTHQPISALKIALQCGGSDGFSAITANPVLGVASDLIVAHGGTVILSETPEIYGAEQLLLGRTSNDEVAQKLIAKIRWWEDYAAQNGGSMDNNPSPGNKLGGITTILEKSLGAVSKAGSTPLRAVYDYAQKVTHPGFVFMDTPGYDPVSVTGQIAGGAQILVFTTGRGSAFGSKPAPTIKVATSDRLYKQMRDDMDINAGDIISGGTSLAHKGQEIFDAICATASGQTTKSEQLGLGDNEFVPWQIGAVM